MAQRLEVGVRAHARHQLVAELAIVGEGGRPIRSNLHRTEVQHAGSRAGLEGREQRGAPVVSDGVVVRGGRDEAREPARGHGERERQPGRMRHLHATLRRASTWKRQRVARARAAGAPDPPGLEATMRRHGRRSTTPSTSRRLRWAETTAEGATTLQVALTVQAATTAARATAAAMRAGTPATVPVAMAATVLAARAPRTRVPMVAARRACACRAPAIRHAALEPPRVRIALNDNSVAAAPLMDVGNRRHPSES